MSENGASRRPSQHDWHGPPRHIQERGGGGGEQQGTNGHRGFLSGQAWEPAGPSAAGLQVLPR